MKCEICQIGRKLTNAPEYRAPIYHSTVKTERAQMLTSNKKTAREHKDDLYFLAQLGKAMGVKF